MKIDARAKEEFRKLWLKTGNYDQVLRALRKTGVEVTREHLRTLRYRLGLPTKRVVLLKHARCVECGKPATNLFNLEKRPQAAVPLCRRCFNRLHTKRFREENPGYKKKENKRYYKKHRKTLLRKQRTKTKSLRTYIQPVTCPVCGEHGYLEAVARLVKNTGHIIGPYYTVGHHNPSYYCYLGRQPTLDNKLPANLICSCPRCSQKREQEKKRRQPRRRRAKKEAR